MNMCFQLLVNWVVRTDVVQTVLKVIRECVRYVNLHCVEIPENHRDDIPSHLA